MKIRSIRYFLVIIFSLTFGNSCRGMWIVVPIIKTALPFAPYIYVGYKMLQSRFNGYTRLEERIGDVHEDVKKVNVNVENLKQESLENFSQTRKDIKDSKTHLSKKIDKTNDDLSDKIVKTNHNLSGKINKTSTNLSGKIDQAKDQLIQKIDESKDELVDKIKESKDEVVEKIDNSRETLEELINTKIEEAKTSINSHIGLTRFDILKNVQDVKEEFQARFDKIDDTLENCVTPDDVQAAEERLNVTIEDMKNMLGDNIAKSEHEVKSFIKKEFLETEERQSKFLNQKVNFLDEKNVLRFEELQKQNNELKQMIQERQDLGSNVAIMDRFNKIDQDVVQMKSMITTMMKTKKRKG